MTGQQTVFVWGACFMVADFWDEWIPGENDDPIPEDWGVPGEGGGPYYGPDAPVTKSPRIDTLPDTLGHLCDDRRDFACLQPLSDTARRLIFDTLPLWLRPLAEIADTAIRFECDTLRQWYERAKAKDIIRAGRTDSFAEDRKAHFAQTVAGVGTYENPALFHIDPRVLRAQPNSENRMILLEAVFHELPHAIGNLEHSNDSAFVANGYPGARYFNAIDLRICFKEPGGS